VLKQPRINWFKRLHPNEEYPNLKAANTFFTMLDDFHPDTPFFIKDLFKICVPFTTKYIGIGRSDFKTVFKKKSLFILIILLFYFRDITVLETQNISICLNDILIRPKKIGWPHGLMLETFIKSLLEKILEKTAKNV
jgi:hypothetical protein